MAAHEPMSIGGSADVRVAPEKLESVPECPWHASLAIPAAKVPHQAPAPTALAMW
jgi:hypothetical protein